MRIRQNFHCHFQPPHLPPLVTRSPTEAASASPPSLDERCRSREYSRVLSKMFRVRVAHGSKLLLGAWRAKGGATWNRMAGIGAPASRSTCAQSLQVSGRSLGMIGVASPSGYTAVQQKTFAILANQVAAAIAVAQLGERRQAMIDTLVNLRADL